MKEYTSKNKINPTTGEKCCVRARTVAVCSLQLLCQFHDPCRRHGNKDSIVLALHCRAFNIVIKYDKKKCKIFNCNLTLFDCVVYKLGQVGQKFILHF